MIVLGYMGVGKSTLGGKGKFIDLDYGDFILRGGVMLRDWEQIYVNVGISLSHQGGVVLMCTDSGVRCELKDRGEPYVVVYPASSLREVWCERLDRMMEKEVRDIVKWDIRRGRSYYVSEVSELSREEHVIEISDMGYSLEEKIKGK